MQVLGKEEENAARQEFTAPVCMLRAGRERGKQRQYCMTLMTAEKAMEIQKMAGPEIFP